MLFKDKSLETIVQSIADSRFEVQIEEDQIREKLKDFYRGIQETDDYLIKYGFERDDKKEPIPRGSVNLTQKIIDKISLVYKYAPRRRLDVTEQMDKEKKTKLAEGQVFEPEQDIYTDWININPWFNRSLKTTERYKNLLHRVLYRPFYFPEAQRWQFFCETDYEPHFIDGDPLHPFAYSYPVKRDTRDTTRVRLLREEDYYVFWSDDAYFIYDSAGRVFTSPPWNPDAPDFGGMNPFGKMPLVEFIKNDAVDRYDENVGAIQLVDANQQINVALMNINMTMHHQMYSQMYITGLSELESKNVRTSPFTTWLLPLDANAGILNYSPEITASMQQIREQIQIIAWSCNVSVQWAMEGTPESGFSLTVRNIDLHESRENDVEIAEIQEKAIYDAISYQQDYYYKTNQLSNEERKLKLPKDANPVIDFQEIDFPINQAEEIDRWERLIKNNIVSPVDWIMSENPDMTEQEAVEKFERNKQYNKKYGGFQDLLREKITQQGGQIQGGEKRLEF